MAEDKNKVNKFKAQTKIAQSTAQTKVHRFDDRTAAIMSMMTGFLSKIYSKLRLPLHDDPDRSLTEKESDRLLKCCPAYDRAVKRAKPKLAGLSYHFDAGEYSHILFTKIYKQIFDGIKNLDEGKAHLAGALFRGRAWIKAIKDYRKIIISENQAITLKAPTEFIILNKENFRVQTEARSDGILVEWTEGNYLTGVQEALTNDQLYDYLTVAFEPEISNTFYGNGLDSYVVPRVKALQVLVNFALKHAETKSEPHVVVFSKFVDLIDSDLQEALASQNDHTMARLNNVMSYFAKALHNNRSLLLGEDDDVKTVDVAGNASAIYSNLIEFLDKDIERWVLLVLGGLDEQGGSLSKAESGRQEQNDLLAWYQKILVENVMQELVRKIYFDEDYAYDTAGNLLVDAQGNHIKLHSNYDEFAKLGLSKYKLPTYKSGEVGKEEPIDHIQIYNLNAQLGVPFMASEYYERTGQTMPPGVPAVIDVAKMQMEAQQAMQAQQMQQMPGDEMGGMPEQGDRERQGVPEESNVGFAETKQPEGSLSLMRLLKKIKSKLEEKIKEYVKSKKADNDKLKESIALLQSQIKLLTGMLGVESINKEVIDNKKTYGIFSEALFQDKDEMRFDLQFEEAIEKLIQANPMLASSAEELRRYYFEGAGYGVPIFGAVYADTIGKLDELKELMATYLQTGVKDTLEQDIQRITNSTENYAETVFRTVSQTAYSIGRQAQEKPLVDAGFIVGYEIYGVDDMRTRGREPDWKPGRENHEVLHGARISVKNPLMNNLYPPYSYNCRCAIRAITRIEAKSEGWIDKDGNLKEYFPPNFYKFKIHEGFGRKFNVGAMFDEIYDSPEQVPEGTFARRITRGQKNRGKFCAVKKRGSKIRLQTKPKVKEPGTKEIRKKPRWLTTKGEDPGEIVRPIDKTHPNIEGHLKEFKTTSKKYEKYPYMIYEPKYKTQFSLRRRTTDDGENVIELDQLNTEKEHRGKGNFKKILKKVAKIFKLPIQIHWIINQGLVKSLEKSGFKTVKEEEIAEGKAVTMRLPKEHLEDL
ncbi:MAG: phage head morphogenesis protein [Bacteroidetes bacterium]|nr:phage head morphogenesis protein [Bacteroidota bacterium]